VIVIRRIVVSALGVLLCAAASSQPLSPALFLPVAASVVRVEAELGRGRLSVGSGVTVAPGTIATACHVVRDASDVRVAGGGGTWQADAEHADARRDVCFLRVPGWNGRPVPLSEADAARVGEGVVALGYTGGAAIMPRMGSVRALHSFDGARVIESNARFNSGSSGGGLFDEEGRLLGLLAFRLRNSEESYFTVPVAWIRAAMPTERDWEPVSRLAASAPFWQGDAEALPYFMRAAAYENAGEWSKLLEVTRPWSAAAPRDPEPLRARGRALRELHRPAAAAEAFRIALRLEPHDAVSLYGLALACAESGEDAAARDAEARLDALDDDVARDLADRLAERGRIASSEAH
jgi:serine protease Do